MHPKKFSLWLLNIGITMLFAGLTSAYVVRKGDGNWYEFTLPTIFLVSTLLILLSSGTMLFAYRSAKKDELRNVTWGLVLTFLLGLAFCVSQFYGWMAMIDMDLHLVTPKEGSKVSGSFVYVISFVHLAHIIAGLIFLLVMIVRSINLKVHKTNLLQIDMCNTYWHFIGLLWVYLYLFLYFAH